jgi:hypothetical protein
MQALGQEEINRKNKWIPKGGKGLGLVLFQNEKGMEEEGGSRGGLVLIK